MSDLYTSKPGGTLKQGRPPTARVQASFTSKTVPSPASPQEGSPTEDTAGTQRLRRVSRNTHGNRFHFPMELVPDGWSYEWKRKSTYGQLDVDHQLNLKTNHWRPVPASRHPNMMPDGHEGAIEKDGMILMERPAYLTLEAQEEDYNYAVSQVTGVEHENRMAPEGTFSRDHPSARRISGIRRTYGPGTAED